MFLFNPDIDECAVNNGLGPCKLRCHNLPGSYRCSCSSGYILAGDGHSCFAECPPGYRKKPLTLPENSTGQNPKLECVGRDELMHSMGQFSFFSKLELCFSVGRYKRMPGEHVWMAVHQSAWLPPLHLPPRIHTAPRRATLQRSV